jgi:hypothetical protein
MQRVSGDSFQARKQAKGAPKGDVPGIFVRERGEVWHLSDGLRT